MCLTGGAAVPFRRLAGASGLHVIILGVGSDPVPEDSLRRLDADCPVVVAHAHRPMPSNLLEVQRWMTRVCLQEGEVLVRQLLNVRWQATVVIPEVGVGVMTHSSEQRP